MGSGPVLWTDVYGYDLEEDILLAAEELLERLGYTSQDVVEGFYKEIVEPEDPESYTLADVREQLRKCEADLKAYREVGGMPEFTLRKQKIFVDALQLLAEKKEFDEKEEAEID